RQESNKRALVPETSASSASYWFARYLAAPDRMQMDPYSAVIFPESFHNFSTRVFERVPSICSHGACDHLSECSQPSESSSSKTKTFSGHLSDNLTAPLCCAGDNSRVRDGTPGIALAVGSRPRSNGRLG